MAPVATAGVAKLGNPQDQAELASLKAQDSQQERSHSVVVAGLERAAQVTEARSPPEAKTDTSRSRSKTRSALLGGLRSGKLEVAVAKMEADEVRPAPPYPLYAHRQSSAEGQSRHQVKGDIYTELR